MSRGVRYCPTQSTRQLRRVFRSTPQASSTGNPGQFLQARLQATRKRKLAALKARRQESNLANTALQDAAPGTSSKSPSADITPPPDEVYAASVFGNTGSGVGDSGIDPSQPTAPPLVVGWGTGDLSSGGIGNIGGSNSSNRKQHQTPQHQQSHHHQTPPGPPMSGSPSPHPPPSQGFHPPIPPGDAFHLPPPQGGVACWQGMPPFAPPPPPCYPSPAQGHFLPGDPRGGQPPPLPHYYYPPPAQQGFHRNEGAGGGAAGGWGQQGRSAAHGGYSTPRWEGGGGGRGGRGMRYQQKMGTPGHGWQRVVEKLVIFIVLLTYEHQFCVLVLFRWEFCVFHRLAFSRVDPFCLLSAFAT